MAIEVLALFAALVLEGTGKMKEHCDCMYTACYILDLLRSGDRVLQHVDELRVAQARHHATYMQIYAVARKPKLHIQRHIPDHLEKHGSSMNCFRGERGLKRQKALSDRAFKQFCDTLTYDALNHFLDLMEIESTFQEVKLAGNIKPMPLEMAQEHFGGGVIGASTSATATNRFGDLHAKDMVFWHQYNVVMVATIAYFSEMVFMGPVR